MTEDIKTRLAEIKYEQAYGLSETDTTYEATPVCWLITQLEQALVREERYRVALEYYKDIDQYCWEENINGKNYSFCEPGIDHVAIEALQSSQGSNEKD